MSTQEKEDFATLFKEELTKARLASDDINIRRMATGQFTADSVNKDMHLSDQALGAMMMALQKSLLEQSDIVPVLKGFKFRLSEDGLTVMNPPMVKLSDAEDFEEE